MIIKKDSKIVKAKGEMRFLALKDKKESNYEECMTFECEDEEYAMAVRDFKKFFKRKRKKQTGLAISMIEAEYVSARKARQQAIWMKQALFDYDIQFYDVSIKCDDKGAIDLSINPVQHSWTKHIKIRHHFLRDNVQKGHISIEKVSSIDNITDILTKPLKRESFNYIRLGLGTMEHIP
nr:retrovirus-related Pol polyprotein from transposon TNT 1-94 [Tanacetum cinerariifolium]